MIRRRDNYKEVIMEMTVIDIFMKFKITRPMLYYWERLGYIKPKRRHNNYRIYNDKEIEKFTKISRIIQKKRELNKEINRIIKEVQNV